MQVNWYAHFWLTNFQEFVGVDFLGNFEVFCEGLKICTSVTDLHLCESNIGDANIELLAAVIQDHTTLSQKLEWLVLNDVNIGGEGLGRILEVFHGKKLSLRNNKLDIAGCKHLERFLQRQSINTLEVLDLAHNALSPDHLRPIMEGLCTTFVDKSNLITSVLVLDLSYCSLGIQGASELAKYLPRNPDLGILKLTSNELSDDGVAFIGDAVTMNHQLMELYLDSNAITDAGLSRLAQSLDNALEVFSLSNNSIKDIGVIDLAQALMSPDNNIEELLLIGNPLTIKAVQALNIALKMSHLKKLSLSFSEEQENIEAQHFEQHLVDLMCESFNVNCNLALGPVTQRILTLAKVRYPSYIIEKKKQEAKNNSVVGTWEQQLGRNNALTKFLRQKQTD